MANCESRLLLVLGGARSGKSGLAESLATAAQAGGSRVTYVATAEVGDAEMAERVALHRQRRPADWHTVEEPFHVADLLRENAGGVFLIDCLTLFISNWLLRLEREGMTEPELSAACLQRVEELIESARSGGKRVIVVSNEVGQGVVPPYPLGRSFRDITGKANQRLAQAADEVHYCVAGLSLQLKPTADGKIALSGRRASAPAERAAAAGDAHPADAGPPPAAPPSEPASLAKPPFWEAPGLALQFLTRLPGPVKYLVPDERLAASLAWFPAIGCLLGLCSGLVAYVAQSVYPPGVAAVAAVVAVVMLTGNLHLDGLMDTADGVFGGYNPARRLEIMRDSRMGAHGVAAGILALALRISLVAALISKGTAFLALPLAMATARWALVLAVRSQKPARRDGFAVHYAENIRNKHLITASMLWLVVAAGVTCAAGPAAPVGIWAAPGVLAGAALATWLLGSYWRRRLGGMTGDTLGATNELVELIALLVLAAI